MSIFKTFVDLFSGIGGFHRALESRGLKGVFASEIDPAAATAYQANFGLKPAGDIAKVRNSDVPPHNVMCGGFPCQPFSKAGGGLGMEDPRNMFPHILRLAKHHQPEVLLLENVPNIMKIHGGAVKDTIEEGLSGIGYDPVWHVLNSADFGAATSRERAYLVGLNRSANLQSNRPRATGEVGTIREVLGGALDFAKAQDPAAFDIVDRTDDMLIPSNRPVIVARHAAKGNMQGYRVYSPDHPGITFTARSGGLFPHTGGYDVDGVYRRLSPLEAMRAQGFPDDHIISEGMEGYKQVGNSVVPQVVASVLDNITKRL